MKSLQESIFDDDLVSQRLPVEKLLISNITIKDIEMLINGINEGDFDNIKNRHLKRWGANFYDKYYAGERRMLWLGTFGIYYPKEEDSREAINWLKFNKIHTDICWNDRMYANSLDIDFFSENNDSIFEWIMFSRYINRSASGAYLLVNRKEYDEVDQKVIHKMIETISKKGAR